MTKPDSKQASEISLTEFLEASFWYRALPAELRTLLIKSTTEKTATAGQYIARAGEPCLHWYGIARGFLQMYVAGSDGSETTLYCVGQGRWAGEGSLLKKELRQYDLRSLIPSRIFMVPVETFEVLRHQSIEFNHFLCDIMNERMGVFVGTLAASRLLSPEKRVAQGLLMLASGQVGDVQDLLIPQHELGLVCGLSRQRVNMALSEFKSLGLLRSETHKGVAVLDVKRLRAYVMEGG
jgi:CRP-like cAMP-binding protein